MGPGARAIPPCPTTGPHPLPPLGRDRPAPMGAGAGRRRSRSRSPIPVAAAERPASRRYRSPVRRSRSADLELSSVWDRPWFVPRGVDDSVRIFSNEFPATGALHPLAVDRARLVPLRDDGRPVGHARPAAARSDSCVSRSTRAARVPRSSPGEMWIDSATRGGGSPHLPIRGHRPLGPARRRAEAALDSARARRLNALGQPGRQYRRRPGVRAAGRTVLDAVPPGDRRPGADSDGERPRHSRSRRRPRSTTTRSTPAGRSPSSCPLPDADCLSRDSRPSVPGAPIPSVPRGVGASRSRRQPARLGLCRPLARRPVRASSPAERRPSTGTIEWPDSLVARAGSRGGSARARDRGGAGSAGRSASRLADRTAHPRVRLRATVAMCCDTIASRASRSVSAIGCGSPGVTFANLYGTVRYGLSDDRVTGRLTLVRDAPGGRLAVSGYRDVVDVDPFSPGAHARQHAQRAVRRPRQCRLLAGARAGAASFETSLPTRPRSRGECAGRARDERGPGGQVGGQRLSRR